MSSLSVNPVASGYLVARAAEMLSNYALERTVRALSERAKIRAELTFLPRKDGKPLTKVLKGNRYRPHIVIGDPAQREAVIAQGNVLTETYCGVAFSDGPDHVEPGQPLKVEMALMYWPHEIYDAVLPGATFTLREGPHIVGYGTVKERWVEPISHDA